MNQEDPGNDEDCVVGDICGRLKSDEFCTPQIEAFTRQDCLAQHLFPYARKQDSIAKVLKLIKRCVIAPSFADPWEC